MAKIFPERPPQSIIDDPLRSAELKVFRTLKSLPDKYRIFYSAHWQNYKTDTGVFEGEADFVIAHPDMGVIVLEVKGGGIKFDAESGKWFSQGRSGTLYEIKDPILQAQRSHYELAKRLRNIPGWSDRKFNIWHTVCFPDVHLSNGQYLKPDLDRNAMLDADDLNDITSSISRVFSHLFRNDLNSGAPGPDRMQKIEGLLANSFEITTPLGVELESEDEKLIQLTEQQFRSLSVLGKRKRAAIAGCAGSGKTMLAIRKAQQFSELGMHVLLLCFNAPLATDLKQRLRGIDVFHFHGLCRQAAYQTGINIRNTTDENELYESILPEALLDASESLGRVYDAIIVDEGQDFKENYWIALESLLKEDGYLYIFYDDNQNLYGGKVSFTELIPEEHFILTVNCRNTKAIHNLVSTYHNDPSELECLGPEGREPTKIQYQGDDDLLRQLQKVLHTLIVEEHIASEDIVILTPRGENKTRLIPGLELGLFTLTDQISNHQSKIQATSIYEFKGLERRVVILAEVDNRSIYNYEMVMYVGCSRARTELIILSENNPAHQIKEQIPDT